jgi:hypothetical protein
MMRVANLIRWLKPTAIEQLHHSKIVNRAKEIQLHLHSKLFCEFAAILVLKSNSPNVLLFNPFRVGTIVLTSYHGRYHGYWN